MQQCVLQYVQVELVESDQVSLSMAGPHLSMLKH